MTELRRRLALARELWAASKRRSREVAVYRDYREDHPLAAGALRRIGPLAVRIGSVRASWSVVGRVEASPCARCQSCQSEHSGLEACYIGVIAGVIVERETREITPELLARVHVDEMWDRYGSPAADWLERHLSWLEVEDEV